MSRDTCERCPELTHPLAHDRIRSKALVEALRRSPGSMFRTAVVTVWSQTPARQLADHRRKPVPRVEVVDVLGF